MIFDQENIFLNDVAATALPATSDIMVNGAGGVANLQPFLYVGVKDGATGETGTVDLEGSVDEAFTTPVVLFSGAAFGTDTPLKMRLPLNARYKYLRLKPTGTFTAGNVLAGLVYDVDIKTGVFV